MKVFWLLQASTARALVLAVLCCSSPLLAAELEEERVNPSEVVFRQGQPYYDDGGTFVQLQTRRIDGELVYVRKVRFDPENGYVDAQGDSVARLQPRSGARRDAGDDGASPWTRGGYGDGYGYGAIRLGASRNRPYGQMYYGNGLYGPDPYSSPHNRDARQRYVGPGYIGSCDLSGCREVHYYGVYDLR